MNHIKTNTTADLFFQISWSSGGVRHTDAYAGLQVNFWRDMLPGRLFESLMKKEPGDMVRLSLSANELIGSVSAENTQLIDRNQFEGSRIGQDSSEPRLGRFYPKGMLRDVPGIFRANLEPFRFTGRNNGRIEVFMGHPLAGKSLDLKVTVGAIRSNLEERGGSVRNWGEIITQGLGMQARWYDQPTDFFADHPFRREDESPDTHFYAEPRLVRHIDDTAIDLLRQTFARLLNDDCTVLDLMSSWQSHLPEHINLSHVTGLGLNEVELIKNDRLNAHIVNDLNIDPHLPFEDHHFDVVLCSLSVEYLISPFRIFEEVARVLKPGGYFVVSFTNRWFAPKAIRIWAELHEFERMGLVLEYFRHGRRFDNLQTYSVRGLSRPVQDKYYGQIAYADPVYVVWGRSV